MNRLRHNNSRLHSSKVYQLLAAKRKTDRRAAIAKKYTQAIRHAYSEIRNLLNSLNNMNAPYMERYYSINGVRRDGAMFKVLLGILPMSALRNVINSDEFVNWTYKHGKNGPVFTVNLPKAKKPTDDPIVSMEMSIPQVDVAILLKKTAPSHADVARVIGTIFARGRKGNFTIKVPADLPKLDVKRYPTGSRRTFKLASGSFIELPFIDIIKEVDEYEYDYYNRLQAWKEHRGTELASEYPKPEKFKYHNTIVYCNPDAQIIIYYKQDRKRRVKTIRGCSEHIEAKDIVRLLTHPSSSVVSFLDSSLGVSIDRLYIQGEAAIAQELNKVNEQLDEEALKDLPPGTVKTKDDFNPVTYLQARGILQLIHDNYPRLRELEQSVAEQTLALHKLTPADMPPLPHWRLDKEVFPHQALTLARTARSDIVPVEVDMGGGKTLMMLYDALVKIMMGKAKRPLIVMPTKLISQQVNELRKWTAGTVNIVALTSSSYRTYGKEEYERLITTAPPNTLFITSYDWLKGDVSLVWDEGSSSFEEVYTRPSWLLSLGIDMVSLDESHKIKNKGTQVYKSVCGLANVPVKRLFSGTIVSNSPADLIAQMSFLDPSIFGSSIDFGDAFVNAVSRSGVPVMWKEGATKRIRESLQRNGGVMLPRSAWLGLLPERNIRLHKVEPDEFTIANYHRILDSTLREFQNMLEDKSVSKAMKAKIRAFLEARDSTGSDGLPSAIIHKLNVLDLFLTAPESDPVVATMIESGQHIVSPKIAKINELLDEHFANHHGKVLIFVRNKIAAKHIKDNIKYSEAAVYYDASTPKNLERFKSDDNVKILVGVDMSLKEGLNITEATRIIRAQLNWNMGDEEQSYGRAFRPGQKHKVTIDILLTDRTIEITKFARLVSKLHVNTLVKSDYSVGADERLHIVTVNKDAITTINSFDTSLPSYIATFYSIEDWIKKEAEEYARKLGDQMLKPVRAVPVGRSIIPVPNIPGASPPVDTSITPVLPTKKSPLASVKRQQLEALRNIKKLAPLAVKDAAPFEFDGKVYNPPKPSKPEQAKKKPQPSEQPPQPQESDETKKQEKPKITLAFVLQGSEYGLRIYTKRPNPKLNIVGFSFYRRSVARVLRSKLAAANAVANLHKLSGDTDGGVCGIRTMLKRVKAALQKSSRDPDEAQGRLATVVTAGDNKSLSCIPAALVFYRDFVIVSVSDDTKSALNDKKVLTKALITKREPSYIQMTTESRMEFRRAFSRVLKLYDVVNKSEIVTLYNKVAKVIGDDE